MTVSLLHSFIYAGYPAKLKTAPSIHEGGSDFNQIMRMCTNQPLVTNSLKIVLTFRGVLLDSLPMKPAHKSDARCLSAEKLTELRKRGVEACRAASPRSLSRKTSA